MSDLIEIINDSVKRRNESYLMQLRLMIASNNRGMEDRDFQTFISNLLPSGSGVDMNKFSRERLEKLRSMQR